MSLAALAGALAIGLALGLLGSGGSILTVPVLVFLVGQDEKLAIAGSLLVVGVIALAGALYGLRARQADGRSVLWFGGAGAAGAALGAALSAFVPGPVQLAIFGVVMWLAAWMMRRPWRASDDWPHAREQLSAFRDRYNAIRPHWVLEPAEGGNLLRAQDVYVTGRPITLPRWQGWAKAAKQRLDEAMVLDAQLRPAA